MNFATKTSQTQPIIWVIWLIVLLMALFTPATVAEDEFSASLLGVTTQRETDGVLYPWQRVTQRWKKWALQRYRAWQQKYRQAQRSAQLARLALKGVVPLAWVVERLTKHQLKYQLGALPVLYALLETLQVRQIINRYCPTQGEVDHGTVALVLVLKTV